MNKNIGLLVVTVIRKSFLIIFSSIMVFSMTRCDDMNSIHEKYYDWGEDIYTGVVDSLKSFTGYEKVKFTWEVNADPRITKTVIFWNNRADSAVVNINRAQSGRLPLEYSIESIDEGNYIFEFITRDGEGHFSLPTEAVVEVYGDFYIGSLKNRGISSISKQEDGSMLIKWDAIASTSIQYVTVKYTIDGVEQTVRVENDETETVLTGLKTGESIDIVTTHLPTDDALETMDALPKEYTMPKFEREINKANFAVVVLAGDNTSVNNSRDLSRIWDGGTTSPNILHTVENAAGFNFPHLFTFDMGVLAEISRFHLWPRTENSPFTGHSPRYFEIWGTDELTVPADNESYWKSDNWKADWKLLGDHEIIKPATSSDQSAEWAAGWEYNVDDTIGRVRYIRLVIKNSNWQGSNCVNIGEITLWGDDI
ncbi:MAG: DUF4998 domain-containing protein [Draconibacterium sp.]